MLSVENLIYKNAKTKALTEANYTHKYKIIQYLLIS